MPLKHKESPIAIRSFSALHPKTLTFIGTQLFQFMTKFVWSVPVWRKDLIDATVKVPVMFLVQVQSSELLLGWTCVRVLMQAWSCCDSAVEFGCLFQRQHHVTWDPCKEKQSQTRIELQDSSVKRSRKRTWTVCPRPRSLSRIWWHYPNPLYLWLDDPYLYLIEPKGFQVS